MHSIAKLYIVIIAISMLAISCTGHDVEDEERVGYEVLEIDLNQETGISMSDYFSGIEYIPLEAPEGKYLGRIRKIVKQDSLLGFFDRARNSVWVYTESGDYINEVRIPVGRGPGEIEHLNDIIITRDFNIHALGAFKIASYDLDGKFLDEVNFDFFIYKISYDESRDEYIGYASNHLNDPMNNEHSGHNLFWINKSGEITKSAIPIPRGHEHMGAEVPQKFPEFNGELYFFTRFADTVYTINNGQVSPRYLLDFGDHSLTEEVFELRDNYSNSKFEWGEFQRNEIFGENYVGLLSEFYESESFIYISFNTGSKHIVIIDKSDFSYSLVNGKMDNDIDYGPTAFFNFLLDDNLYTILHPHELEDRLEDLKNNKPEKFNSSRVSKIKEISEILNETDNPVLKIVSFKK